jgi:hypothetical protein
MVHSYRGLPKSPKLGVLCLICTLGIIICSASFSSGAEILYIAGENDPKAADKSIIKHLRSRGFSVQVKEDALAQPSDAENKDLVFISESVLAMKVSSKFRNIATPVICSEPWLYDDFGMTGTEKFKDFGRKAKQKTICITDSTHPLAAALSGTVQVSSKTNYFGWGIPGKNAIRVACLSCNPNKYVIFGYNSGAEMPGLVAPGKRIGFFMFKNSGGCLTANGWCLLDAVVDWSLEEDSGNRHASN